MSTTTRTPTTIARENWRVVGFVVLLALVFVSTIAVVGLTPSTSIPIGVSATSGESMAPTYGTSGVALYADAGELEQGDVVVFYNSVKDNHIQHRVVEKTPHGFVTQGDNVGATDQALGAEYVTSANRVGEVYFVIDEKGVHFPGF